MAENAKCFNRTLCPGVVAIGVLLMTIIRRTLLLLLASAGMLALPSAGDAQQLPLFAPLDTMSPIPFSIVVAPESAAEPHDPQLCRWALDDWSRASGGLLQFEEATGPGSLLEINFVAAQSGQYGEMRPLLIDGRRGAAVYVRPDTDALGPDIGRAARADPLLRDSIVYLTCLHELGHAVGLEHTDGFADIMYFFGFGGDIERYFGRYRERLETRDDIAAASGLSERDVARLHRLYPSP